MQIRLIRRWLLGFILAMIANSAGKHLIAAEGFSPFNGKDLTGWVAEGKTHYKQAGETKPNWFVSGGMLQCAGHGYGFLRYDKKLADFKLTLEYKMSKGCNSGVGIRTLKYNGVGSTRPAGPSSYEIQILDDSGKEPTRRSGMSLYKHVAAKVNAAKPAGEWNVMVVECRGPKIRITLNDKVVIDYDQSQAKSTASKSLEGYFSVQCHGSEITYRNFRVEEFAKAGDK